MSVLGEVFGDASDKSKSVMSSAFSGITGVYKDAIAANKADDIVEADTISNDAREGVLHNTGILHDIGDGIEDGLNVATMGVSRKITNVFTKEIDYKALKAAKKEAKSSGTNLTVKDRTVALSDIVDTDKYYSDNSTDVTDETSDVAEDEEAEL